MMEFEVEQSQTRHLKYIITKLEAYKQVDHVSILMNTSLFEPDPADAS